MKKLIFSTLALAVVATGATAIVGTSTVNATSGNCEVVAVGTENSANRKNSKFVKQGNKVTGKFKVTGKDCNEKVTIASWESPNATNRPLSAQRLHDSATGTFKAGVHTLTVEVATDTDRKVPGCFYQVDMVKGGKADMDPSTPGAERYGKERLMGWVVGGREKCNETPGEETPVETPETPGKGGEETPEAIAETGPAAIIGGLFGSSAVGYSAVSYFRSRRDLMRTLLNR